MEGLKEILIRATGAGGLSDRKDASFSLEKKVQISPLNNREFLYLKGV